MATLAQLETLLDNIGGDIDNLLVTVEELKEALGGVELPPEAQAKIDELVSKAQEIDSKFPS